MRYFIIRSEDCSVICRYPNNLKGKQFLDCIWDALDASTPIKKELRNMLREEPSNCLVNLNINKDQPLCIYGWIAREQAQKELERLDTEKKARQMNL